ncbi:MAG: ribonuclease P protein component [Candidatus Methylacidiphilales bacterium]|nr:ribonuclease P protein component [Candidatus Methylacidiphilales bacterium]
MPATPRLELGRDRILRQRQDFDRIRRDGQRVVGRFLVCNYLTDPAHPTRAAFVIGKACGGAVARNRLKRRLREIYRRFAQSHLIPGLQSVWIARQNAAPAEFAVLREELLRLYRKAGLTTGARDCGEP